MCLNYKNNILRWIYKLNYSYLMYCNSSSTKGVGMIENTKTYLQVSIPILVLIGIFLGIYIYLERQNNTEDNSKNKKKHSL